MAIPFNQAARVGAYVVKQKLLGRKRYPLVLMLEPLFQCNLACVGCGKIDFPDPILQKRMSVQECLDAVDECGAPIVNLPGGEPLLHKEIGEIAAGIVARKKFLYICTNALLLKKKIHLFKPSPYLNFTIHLDGMREEHDHSVNQAGVFDRCIEAIDLLKEKGFRVTINCTFFNNADPLKVADFFDYAMKLGVEGIVTSPGYAYERAPVQDHFMSRIETKTLFRNIFRLGKERGAKWDFNLSPLFLDFLAGNQSYECTPWGLPTRNIFGWQKPCYLLGEGYAKTFKELMEETAWDSYGVGRYEKCANCMVSCGFEPTAVDDTFKHPIRALKVALFGPNTERPMAPDIDLTKARPAQYRFEEQVKELLAEVEVAPAKQKAVKAESVSL
ncbi:MAG: adenosyl-hopene transferase HpnH [Rickettsiales bacterium]|nr:adenosyl-hopene transferase HpnH [Rickettsiales bacterium]